MRFDPAEIQREYLLTNGFREELIELVRVATLPTRDDYVFSQENEAERMTASVVLQDLFDLVGPRIDPIDPFHTSRRWRFGLEGYVINANQLLRSFGLQPLTDSDLDL